jgi:thiol-disulfide isomerase/thioredoxin
MTLETMTPDPVWDAEANAEAVAALAHNDDLRYLVWAGDWCPDCRRTLPSFAAALAAAGVPDERVEQFPVETENGRKVGPGVEEYGIEFIPTVIVERDGEELFRYVEDEGMPVAAYVARVLADRGG